MANIDFDENELKQVFKAALAETLEEQRELLYEVFAEVLEDFALSEAIREGMKTRSIPRGQVFRILRRKM